MRVGRSRVSFHTDVLCVRRTIVHMMGVPLVRKDTPLLLLFLLLRFSAWCVAFLGRRLAQRDGTLQSALSLSGAFLYSSLGFLRRFLDRRRGDWFDGRFS